MVGLWDVPSNDIAHNSHFSMVTALVRFLSGFEESQRVHEILKTVGLVSVLTQTAV